MDVKVGTYTGNGSDDRAITGVGFQPGFVLIKSSGTDRMVFRSSGFSGDVTANVSAVAPPAANRIQSFDADGFTLGTDATVNSNGVTYYYLAIGGDGVGTIEYTGDGTDNRSLSGLGFTPALAISARFDSAGEPCWSTTPQSAAGVGGTLNGTSNANAIQALESDGFQVGSDAAVNANAGTYTIAGFDAASTDRLAVFTYVGNGADNRSISGIGFQPDYVFLRAAATGFPGVMRFADQVGDSTLVVASQDPLVNVIQAFESDGFQVGSSGFANQSGFTFYGFAFKSGAGDSATSGTGAVSTGAATADGDGVMQPSGSGAVSTGAPTVAGAGVHMEDAAGSGAVVLGAATADGTGIMQPEGVGAPTLGAPTATGAGVHMADAAGSGTPTVGAATSAGVGGLGLAGSGAVSLGAATASGTGIRAKITPTYVLEIDLDQSGLYDADEDLTADVTADAGSPLLVTERGHDLTRVLSPPLAGAASFILDNTDGDYSPGSNLKAGREMRLRATFGGTEYDVWRGFLDHPVQTPPGGTIKRVAVQCFGNLARLAGRTVSTELYSDIKTGAAIGHLLDAAGFPAGLRDIDTGETTLSWWWLDNEDALSALEVLKNSEGPGAALYEDGAGKIVFRGRYARNTEASSTTVQTTFNSGDGDEPRIGLPFAYVPGIKDVVNVCTIDAVTREAQTLAEVWALGETVTLAPNETKKFVARNSNGDPFTDAVAPTTGDGDYTVSSGSVSSVTLDRDSGASVTISITGGASGAEVTGLRLRAKLVTVQNSSSLTNTIDTSTSQGEFGERPYRLRVRPEIGVNVAQDFANAVVGFYKDGLPITTLVLQDNVAEERMTAALAREVGDRVRVVVGDELDQEMYVEHIRHEVITQGYQRTTFGLTQAQGIVSYFTLDESELDGDDVLAF